MSHAFFSYLSEDEVLVRTICDTLHRVGVETWLDREQLTPGESWQEAIKKAISEGTHFLACFSKNFDQRADTYMSQEVKLAAQFMTEQLFEDNRFIVVMFSECALPPWPLGDGRTLRDLHALNLDGRWVEGLVDLVAMLGLDLNDTDSHAETHLDAPSRLLHRAFAYYPVQQRWQALYRLYLYLQNEENMGHSMLFQTYAERGMEKAVFGELVHLALDTYGRGVIAPSTSSAMLILALNQWDHSVRGTEYESTFNRLRNQE